MFKNNGIAYPVELAKEYILTNLTSFTSEVRDTLIPMLGTTDFTDSLTNLYHVFHELLVNENLPARESALNVFGFAAITVYTYALASREDADQNVQWVVAQLHDDDSVEPAPLLNDPVILE